jgi:hypothetical protein
MSEPSFRLSAAEIRLLDALGQGHDWLRAALCTIGRRGIAYRQGRPEAAQTLLDALSTSPLYKAGQFFFDLMEWEDFMLDGPAPPILANVLDAAALQRLAALLDKIKSHLDGAPTVAVGSWRVELAGVLVDQQDLPSLAGGLYIYRDCVLGALMSVLPLLEVESGGLGT